MLSCDPLTDSRVEKTQMPDSPWSANSVQGPYPVLFVMDEKLVVVVAFYFFWGPTFMC